MIDHFNFSWKVSPVKENDYYGRVADDTVLMTPGHPIRFVGNDEGKKISAALEPHQPLYYRVMQQWRTAGQGSGEESVSNVIGPGALRLRVGVIGSKPKEWDGDRATLRAGTKWANFSASLGHVDQGFHYHGAKIIASSDGWTAHAWTESRRAGWNNSWGKFRVPIRTDSTSVNVTVEAGEQTLSRTISIEIEASDDANRQTRIDTIIQRGVQPSRNQRNVESAQSQLPRTREGARKSRERAEETVNEIEWIRWGSVAHNVIIYDGEVQALFEHEVKLNQNEYELKLARARDDLDAQYDIATRRVRIFEPSPQNAYVSAMLEILERHLAICDEVSGKMREEKNITQQQGQRRRYSDRRDKLRGQLARKQNEALRLLYDAAIWRGDIATAREAAMARMALLDTYESQLGFHANSARNLERVDVRKRSHSDKTKILRKLADDLALLTGNRQAAKELFEQHWQHQLAAAYSDDVRTRVQNQIDSGYRPNWWPVGQE